MIASSSPAPVAVAAAPPSLPREHLDPRARTLWRISGVLNVMPLIAALIGGLWFIRWLDLDVPWTLPLVGAFVLGVVPLVLALTLPGLIWRRWRYEIRDDEVDLQRGLVTVTRTLTPMARIQHVDTRRGPLQRRFGLASVILYTAAGASEIPALADEVAATVRDRIAALANVHDDL